jgi:DNA processing protein
MIRQADLAEHREAVARLVEQANADGIRLTTVLDPNYPANLRLVYNLPPFLFYRGELRPDDAYSVAVVGTLRPSPGGLARAQKLASLLSGLARGIDTAAHEACLAAGGRTIAVLGSGVRRIYPPENADLAERIAAHGAVVSQFWPDTSPTPIHVPPAQCGHVGDGSGHGRDRGIRDQRREAASPARDRAGQAGFPLSSLVTNRPWARRYLARPGVTEVSEVGDIIRSLRSPDQVERRAQERWQLSLDLV